jgi:hypothetical protein
LVGSQDGQGAWGSAVGAVEAIEAAHDVTGHRRGLSDGTQSE